MKRIYIVLILLVVAGVVALIVGLRMYYKQNANTADLKANVLVTVEKLTADFKTDSAKARKKYNNDIIEMTGTVDKTEKDPSGHVYLDFTANNTKVQCMAQTDANADLEKVKAGQAVKLKGKFTGYTFDEMIDPQPQLQFRDCIIVNN